MAGEVVSYQKQGGRKADAIAEGTKAIVDFIEALPGYIVDVVNIENSRTAHTRVYLEITMLWPIEDKE